MSEAGHLRAVVVLAGLTTVAVIVASVVDGPPRVLPDIALGWTPILYLERAGMAALLIIGLGGLSSSMLGGGRVMSVGGGPLPSIDLDQVRTHAATLSEGLETDISHLSARIEVIETRLEWLEGQSATAERGR